MGDWLLAPEDPGLLDATLSLLESWDGGSGDQSNATRVAVDADQKQRPKRSINVCRERRKQELLELRSTASELETQLTTLQHRRAMQLRPHFSGGAVLSTAPIWENMARRQFKARKQSEAVNAKLRERLDMQAQAARDLFNAIELAVRSHRAVQPVKPLKLRIPIDVSQRMSDKEQLKRLHANHEQWQWALSLSPKFHQGTLEFTEFLDSETDGCSATLELHCSHVFPYPVADVAKALWSTFLDDSGEDDDDDGNSYIQEHRSVDNLATGVFMATCTIGGEVETSGKKHGKWAVKQDSLDGGKQSITTMQWYYELSEFGKELDGVRVVEDSWTRLIDARDIGHGHLTEPLAVAQQVWRVRLQLSDNEPLELEHVDRVIKMFKKQAEDDLEWIDSVLENALMAPSIF